MIVFSTLEPDQIDLNRTQSEGVAALKSFLEYASGKDLSRLNSSETAQNNDLQGISRAICEALEENGYETQRNVGHSQYRIDIGVVDPNDAGRYLLGILLDGATYRSSKTVRDRELAQISVLEGLGWHIARVWSMDWWDNSRKELARLLAILNKIKEESAKAAEDHKPDETELAEDRSSEPATLSPDIQSAPDPSFTEAPIQESVEIIPDVPDADSSACVQPYKAAGLKSLSLTAEDIVQPACKKMVKDAIRSVIDKEAPVSEARLVRRVIQSFGITRMTGKVQAFLSETITSLGLNSTIQFEDRIIWKNDQSPDDYSLIRVSGEGDCKRDIKEIPVQEAANAVCLVLHEQIGMSRDDLIKESAKLMGFARLGSNVTACFESAVQYADEKSLLSFDENGNVRLSELGIEYASRFN